jgi:hypothetical protein
MILQQGLATLAIAASLAVSLDHLVDPPMRTSGAEQTALACERSNISWGNRGLMALEGRASPYDSLSFTVGGAPAKVCYGRPSARERQIFGGLIPYDSLWRTGANEPTTVHLAFPAEIAGLPVPAGSYTLYSVPGRETWSIIVNRSTSQWGLESDYTPEVRAQEVGRATVSAQRAPAFVETFTISARPTGPRSTELLLEWENTRVAVPILLATPR